MKIKEKLLFLGIFNKIESLLKSDTAQVRRKLTWGISSSDGSLVTDAGDVVQYVVRLLSYEKTLPKVLQKKRSHKV